LNPVLFPLILRSHSGDLTDSDLALDDEVLSSISSVVEQPRNLFLHFSAGFHQMLHDFANDGSSNSRWHVRGLILVLSFGALFDGDNFATSLLPVIRHIGNLPVLAHSLFFTTLQFLPRTLRYILGLVQTHLTLDILHHPDRRPDSSNYLETARFIQNLCDDSSALSETPLPAFAFSNESYTDLFSNRDHETAILILQQSTAILTLPFKRDFLNGRLLAHRQQGGINALRERIRANGPQMMGTRIRQQDYSFELRVRRDRILDDTIEVIRRAPVNVLARPLMVTFVGEEGLDDGGVSREYFHLLMAQLFSPDHGMFKVVNGKYYWFNRASYEGPLLFQTLGTTVALGVYNSLLLPIRFPLLFYKKLLAKPINLNDLVEFDPDLVRGLKQMLQMVKDDQDVSALAVTFSVTVENFGATEEIPLIDGGEHIEVTNDNAEMYVNEYVDWFARRSVEAQFKAFRIGFEKLFPPGILNCFCPDELDMLVSGEEVMEWKALQQNARYIDGYNPTSRAVKWFWEIFETLSNSEKCKFLQFTTGTDRAPIGGLSSVVITIQRTGDPSKLPVSHTCFSVFGLPDYPSKMEMRRKIMIALTQTEGFGLI
jgi:ubiquitin-protein ligase E3 A